MLHNTILSLLSLCTKAVFLCVRLVVMEGKILPFSSTPSQNSTMLIFTSCTVLKHFAKQLFSTKTHLYFSIFFLQVLTVFLPVILLLLFLRFLCIYCPYMLLYFTAHEQFGHIVVSCTWKKWSGTGDQLKRLWFAKWSRCSISLLSVTHTNRFSYQYAQYISSVKIVW